MGYKEIARMRNEEVTRNRDEVLYAIIEMTVGHYEINPPITYYQNLNYNKTQDGVTSSEITQHINDKCKIIIEEQLKDVERRYENGEIDKEDRDRRTKHIEENNSFNLRTVQRALKFLINKEMIYKQEDKYFITDNCKYSIKHSSYSFGSQLLSSIMQLHQPSFNTLERNIRDLIMMFGSYVFISLLEASRPLDDDYIQEKNNEPLTLDEKNIFTEKWLREVINVPLLYKFFLETFLNQPDDKLVEGIIKVRFKETRKIMDQLKFIYIDSDGNEYDHLYGTFYEYRYIDKNGKELFPPLFDPNEIAVPVRITPIIRFHNTFPFPGKPYDIIYELNSGLYDNIRKKISENYPEVYNRFLDGPGGEFRGSKNNDAAEIYSKIKRKKTNY